MIAFARASRNATSTSLSPSEVIGRLAKRMSQIVKSNRYPGLRLISALIAAGRRWSDTSIFPSEASLPCVLKDAKTQSLGFL